MKRGIKEKEKGMEKKELSLLYNCNCKPK